MATLDQTLLEAGGSLKALANDLHLAGPSTAASARPAATASSRGAAKTAPGPATAMAAPAQGVLASLNVGGHYLVALLAFLLFAWSVLQVFIQVV